MSSQDIDIEDAVKRLSAVGLSVHDAGTRGIYGTDASPEDAPVETTLGGTMWVRASSFTLSQKDGGWVIKATRAGAPLLDARCGSLLEGVTKVISTFRPS